MKIEILPDREATAHRAARFIAREAQVAAGARGVFTFAVSGGQTPWQMLRALGALPMPWPLTHLFQVDERVAPRGDPERNLTYITESLLSRVTLTPAHLHAMPVEAPDLRIAAVRYAQELEVVAGRPPILDLVHLGLGLDGHTASLVPNDPVLEEPVADVAVTAPYLGRQRLTLTYPVLNRARCVLWVVTGTEKTAMLARLMNGDRSIPAGRVNAERAVILADAAAAGAALNKVAM